MKRRTILLGASAGAIAGMLSESMASAAPKLAGKTAIVVGSGFGGAVAAYRLGQLGVRTTVLERGPQREAVAMPEWLSHTRSPALTRHHGDGLTVLSGAGVGGGSLISGITLAQPRRQDWERVYPSELRYDQFDKVYWPRARKSLRKKLHSGNVTVLAQHEVTEIREGFVVVANQLGADGEVLAAKTFTADYVFLAAGAFHTTSLLVTSQARGWLPKLRDTVGKGFGNNGDFLVARLNSRRGGGKATVFDDTNPYAPAAMTPVAMPVPAWATRTTTHLVTSIAPERGEVRYDAVAQTGRLHWPYSAMDTRSEQAGRDLATRLWRNDHADKGYAFHGLPAYDRTLGQGFGSATTWSPLGGMVMGEATDFGGQSLDYPGLYCVDGSVLPGSSCLAGPALTIAANAERCMDLFVAQHAE